MIGTSECISPAPAGEGRPGEMLLTSRLLTQIGVPHGFTTRRGGVSRGMFASLNFGNPGDLPAADRDPPSNIQANFDRVFDQLSLRGRELVQVHQVHGSDVHIVRQRQPAHDGPNDTRADALVTDDPGRVLAVRVADCTPVLIASRDGRLVAAVHAGWRGVVGNVAGEAVRALRALAPHAEFAAGIGPCIGKDAFEVGPEVAAAFRRVFGSDTPHVRPNGTGDRSLVDLKGAIAEQLAAAGIAPGSLDVLPHCTVSGPALFFSHRRDNGVTGRMVAVIGPRA